MKNALILLLFLLLALSLAGGDRAPRAVIENTRPPLAAIKKADLPAWRPPDGDESRLFATCPLTPWSRPQQVREHAV